MPAPSGARCGHERASASESAGSVLCECLRRAERGAGMSYFAGLSTALTALHAHRRSMEVVSQNIANVSTEGYSRQRADLQAIGGPVIPGVHANSPGIG